MQFIAKYCVNCGNQYTNLSSFCPFCLCDQIIPNEIIDKEINQYNYHTSIPSKLHFGYPGEKVALFFSILLSLILVIVLGSASFGIIFLIFSWNLLYLYIGYKSNQKNLIRVSGKNFKNIHKISKLAAHRLKISLPEIFIINNPSYNAYATGFFQYAYIVVHDSLVQDLTPEELLFVIGHEMGHIKCQHTTWLMLQNPSHSANTRFLFAPIIRIIFNAWSIKAEYTADQAGIIACKNAEAAISSLTKLASGKSPDGKFDVNDMINSKDEVEDMLNVVTELFGSHPLISNRIKQALVYSSKVFTG